MAIVDIFADFYRYSHNEIETEQVKNQLRDSVRYFCNLSENYGDGWDILDVIKSQIFTYIDNNPRILIGQIDKIEGIFLEAVEKESAIFYDSKYYYFPKKILRTLIQDTVFRRCKI